MDTWSFYPGRRLRNFDWFRFPRFFLVFLPFNDSQLKRTFWWLFWPPVVSERHGDRTRTNHLCSNRRWFRTSNLKEEPRTRLERSPDTTLPHSSPSSSGKFPSSAFTVVGLLTEECIVISGNPTNFTVSLLSGCGKNKNYSSLYPGSLYTCLRLERFILCVNTKQVDDNNLVLYSFHLQGIY